MACSSPIVSIAPATETPKPVQLGVEKESVDLGLAILCALRAEGKFAGPLTQAEIAEACGVTRQAISLIEARAMKKVCSSLAARHTLKGHIPLRTPTRHL